MTPPEAAPPEAAPPDPAPPDPAPPEAEIVARLRAAGCVFAEDEARLLREAAATGAELAVMVQRRVTGLPLEQIIGWAEFCGLRIVVEPGVFVPRRRTGFLVRQASARVRPGAVVVDLCCGSGAVGAGIAAAVIDAGIETGIELYAADIEPAAVRCARRNIEPLGGRVLEGDLFDPLPDAVRGRIDILAVNAPYVPTEKIALMPPEARVHEPRVSLDGGADGLDVQRRVAAGAPEWLVPGGCLLIETSASQAPHTAGILARSGLTPQIVTDDELSATVVIGTATPRRD